MVALEPQNAFPNPMQQLGQGNFVGIGNVGDELAKPNTMVALEPVNYIVNCWWIRHDFNMRDRSWTDVARYNFMMYFRRYA